MRFILLLFCCFIQFQLSQQINGSSGCNDDWTPSDSYCFKYFNNTDNWLNAETECQKLNNGSHLASVENANEWEIIQKLIPDSYSGHVWLGLSKFCPGAKKAKWTDGLIQNDSYGKSILTNECGGMIKKDKDLVSLDCDTKASFVCKMPNTNLSSKSEKGDACGGWDWCSFNDDHCIKIQKEMNWAQAHEGCVHDGQNLVSINSAEFEKNISQYLLELKVNETFWTGLNKFNDSDNMFRWSDRSSKTYPNVEINLEDWPNKDCFAINYTMNSNAITWLWTKCDQKFSSICLKHIQTPNTTVTSTVIANTTITTTTTKDVNHTLLNGTTTPHPPLVAKYGSNVNVGAAIGVPIVFLLVIIAVIYIIRRRRRIPYLRQTNSIRDLVNSHNEF